MLSLLRRKFLNSKLYSLAVIVYNKFIRRTNFLIWYWLAVLIRLSNRVNRLTMKRFTHYIIIFKSESEKFV